MTVAKLKTWTNTQAEEDLMNHGHYHHWQTMIDLMAEKDLRYKTVLDFGCNQGGFLRALYDRSPYAKAIGIDIAEESVAVANDCAGNIPATYQAADIALSDAAFDIAFSHEVIYLLPDLNAHAQMMRRILKPGAVYYAATGCHTDNPLWDQWYKVISSYSNIPVPQYAVNDYIESFAKAGFTVEFRPFGINRFIKIEADDSVYFPSAIAKADYYARHKLLFRCVRGA